jgi:hypothetical protein
MTGTMSIENISAGLVGAARTTPQRPTKNALISNTDNAAVQQYAQVSRFTSYLADTPVEQAEPQQYQQSSSQCGNAGYGASSGNSGSGEAPAPVLNYGRNGSTTPLEKPNVVGQFLSVVA